MADARESEIPQLTARETTASVELLRRDRRDLYEQIRRANELMDAKFANVYHRLEVLELWFDDMRVALDKVNHIMSDILDTLENNSIKKELPIL